MNQPNQDPIVYISRTKTPIYITKDRITLTLPVKQRPPTARMKQPYIILPKDSLLLGINPEITQPYYKKLAYSLTGGSYVGFIKRDPTIRQATIQFASRSWLRTWLETEDQLQPKPPWLTTLNELVFAGKTN